MLMAAVGSAVPPALLAAGFPKLALEEGGYPAGTELIEIPLRNRGTLRGVYVPADPGAPLVLHLLESMGSATYDSHHILGYPCLQQFQDLGFASLMVDYRGIGASDGKRNPRHLRRDSKAMWETALGLVDGNPQKLVVRALSLGSLGAACLLRSGRVPAAVLCMAPIRSETVVRNWITHYYASGVRWVARLLALKRPVRVNILKALANCPAPLFVYAPEKDYALPPAEMARMRAAVVTAGGRWASSHFNHSGHVLDAHGIGEAELRFLQQIFPECPPKEARIERMRNAAQGTPLQADQKALEVASPWWITPARLGPLVGADVDPLAVLQQIRHYPLESLREFPHEALMTLLYPSHGASAKEIELLQRLLQPGEFPAGIALKSIQQAHGIPSRTGPQGEEIWSPKGWLPENS